MLNFPLAKSIADYILDGCGVQTTKFCVNTHERLQDHLWELVNPKIAEHRGRIVKNTGDGFLAEFASVVDAVRSAAEIQRVMIDREPEVP
jgi:class 3 adenylate cyclase